MKIKFRNNIFFVLFSCLILTSCCYNGLYSKNGLCRRKISDFKLKNTYVDNIDTLAIYKEKINFALNSITKEYVYFEKNEDNTYPYVSYLKFFKNNKVGTFSIKKTDTLKLTREHFDPSKATMGYYSVEGNKIKVKFSIVFQCSHQILRKRGIINKDTITTIHQGHSGTIYVKRNIEKKNIENWKPDW